MLNFNLLGQRISMLACWPFLGFTKWLQVETILTGFFQWNSMR